MKQYNIRNKKSSPSTPILANAADFLMKKLRKAHSFCFVMDDAGEIRQVPSSIRGNASYAYFQSFRLNDLQKQLANRLISDGKTYTNTLFITNTLRYDPRDPADIDRVWTEGYEAIERYVRKLRKLGVVDYCLALEAFEGSGFHIHLVVILDRTVSMLKHISTKKKRRKLTYRLTNLELLLSFKQAWADAVRKPLKEAQSDVQCCYSKGFAGYLVKELKKASSVESALKRYRQGKETSADVKKIIAFYMADKLRIRLLRVSRGLSSVKNLEVLNQLPDQNALVTERNNSTDLFEEEKRIPIFSIILSRKELYQICDYKTFVPFTGKIDESFPQYQKIRDLFDERFGVSSLFEDTKRFKAFVEKKKHQIKDFERKKEATFSLVAIALSG